MKPSDALRAAVKNSGETRYRIAQETGMTESGLSRFVHGGGLNLASLDRLAGYLGLELVPTRTQASGKHFTTAKGQKRKG
jgi:transcriptional regulator with XRE-family HTH domain